MARSYRVQVLTGFGLLLLVGLGVRLYALTVHRHEELRLDAERRSRRAEIISARRGPILDRHGRPLALDHPVRDVVLDMPTFDPSLNLVAPLSRVLDIPPQAALTHVRRARKRAPVGDRPEERPEVLLAVLPANQLERVQRLPRRSRLRWDLGPRGVRILADAPLLRARTDALTRLADLLDQPRPVLAKRLEERVDAIFALESRRERLEAWQVPLAVLEDAPFALIARIEERAFELAGVRIRQRYVRRYPQRDCAVHVVGYTRGPTPAEAHRDQEAGIVLDARRDALGLLLADRDAEVDLGSEVRLRQEGYGRTGVERTHDLTLRGTPGVRVVVRDVKNRVRDSLIDVQPRDGKALRLTLDVELQRSIERALDRQVLNLGEHDSGGAAVVIDLRHGDLLALATSPRFDPNELGKNYAKLVKRPRRPLRNRAVEALPPASTLKVLTSFAIFDPRGGLPLDWSGLCQRSVYKGKRGKFRCEGYHGQIRLERAMECSCNQFFFRAADEVGLSPLSTWAGRFGLGQPLVDGLFGQQAGLFPREGYKQVRLQRQTRALQTWRERVTAARANEQTDPNELARLERRLKHAIYWRSRFAQDLIIQPGEIRNSIIGQGDVLTTPIQIAWVAGLVATGGEAPRPRLVLDAPVRMHRVDLDLDVLAAVREGMKRVVTRGTASKRSIGLTNLDLAGKTGTSQRGAGQPYIAWFMGYYPASAPEIAFVVMVDRTKGHGGGVCGPVARKLLEAYEQTRGGTLR